MIKVNNKDIRKSPIIYIEWYDSISLRGWTYTPDLLKDSISGLRICSVGYLIKETKDTITISTSLSVNNSNMDPLTIPKIAITKRKRLMVE